MGPNDEWLTSLDFCLIINSLGEISPADFSPERLARAYAEHPSRDYLELGALACELIVEFQARMEDARNESEVSSNGPVSIPLPQVSHSL